MITMGILTVEPIQQRLLMKSQANRIKWSQSGGSTDDHVIHADK